MPDRYPAPLLPDVDGVASLPDRDGASLTYAYTPASNAYDNSVRALFAIAGLKAYAKTTGQLTSEPIEQVIRDLLSDLRHLCDALGEDVLEGQSFYDLVERSQDNYTAEIHGMP